MAAKSLAARLVYRKGINALEKMPTETICSTATDFLRLEKERDRLAAEVDMSNLEDSTRIADLLRQTGILSTIIHESRGTQK